MKRLITIIIFLVYASVIYAEHIPKDKATEVAQKYFNYKAKKEKSTEVSSVIANEFEKVTTFYIVNFKEGGFVIVSADDRIEPILAYSIDNSANTKTMNPEVKYWLNNYSKSIKEVIDEKKTTSSVTKGMWENIENEIFPKEKTSVAPLLTTTWNQDAGYNDYCPGGYTGCVATAMSQIMNYHEFPVTGTKSHSYIHPTYGEQSIDFSSVNYDWASMPDNSGSDAVAVLMRHAGVSVDMDYSTDGSGAFSRDVTYALANYFKYDQEIKYIEQADYSDIEWLSIIKAELDNLRPVYYSGHDPVNGGHAWVCDGYDDSDKLHLNWGWGGSYNGYFTLGNFNAGGFQPNDDNAVIINIMPSTPNNEQFLAVRKFSDLSNQTTNSSPYIGYIDAVDENVAWGIARDGSGSGADYRVYTRTTDGGNTWTAKKVEDLGGVAFSMICAISDQVAYISMYGNGTDNHVLKTTDGGNTWASVLDGAGSYSFFNVVHFFDENNGFSQGDPESGYFELYTTTNGGSNWTRVPSANIPAPLSGEYGIVGLYTAVADTIWFTTNKGRVYKSKDKGLTWDVYTIYSGSNSTGITIAFDDSAQNGVAHVSLSNGTNHVGDEYYKTVDGGETWIQIVSPKGNFYKSDISSIPGVDNAFISVGADYETPMMGISYTLDGGDTWIEYPEYYQNFQFLSVDMVNSSKGFIGTFAGEWSGGVWPLYGTYVPKLKADFYAEEQGDTLFCASGVTFTDNSQGFATSWDWDFGTDATPSSASGIGPHDVTFSSGGEKNIKLLISDGTETNELTLTIKVSGNTPADITTIEGPTSITNASTVTYSVAEDAELYTYYNWSVEDNVWAGNGSTTNEYDVTFSGEATNSNIICFATNGCGSGASFSLPVGFASIDVLNNEIKIYPNPANNVLSINGVDGKMVTIYNMVGKLMYKEIASSEKVNIDLSKFSTGVYTLSIYFEGQTLNSKFIVK